MSGTSTPTEWTCAEFDPRNVRLLSILSGDSGEDYCVRHEQQMQKVVPVVHHSGALYTTADGVACYTCGVCLSEVLSTTVEAPRVRPNGDDVGTDDLLRSAVSREFDRWDAGDAPGEWFQCVRDEHRDDVDPDDRYVWLAATREDAKELVADITGDDAERTDVDGEDNG